MLRPVCLHLARDAKAVSVAARPSPRLQSLVGEGNGKVHGIGVDWADEPALGRGVDDAIARHGPVGLVVCWAHSDAPHVPMTVARAVADAHAPPRFFQVYGGRADASSPTKRAWHESLSAMPGIAYRRVTLWAEGGQWLPDARIAQGVIGAIEADAVDRLVRPERAEES
jgi:hypothetical protein